MYDTQLLCLLATCQVCSLRFVTAYSLLLLLLLFVQQSVIDSYFAATMILFSLQHDRSMEETQLVHRSQWLAEV